MMQTYLISRFLHALVTILQHAEAVIHRKSPVKRLILSDPSSRFIVTLVLVTSSKNIQCNLL